MYLHLGNNYVIKNSEIIGIFDIRNKRTNLYRLFLKPQLGTSKVLDLTDAYPPASCIVTSDKIIFRYFEQDAHESLTETQFGRFP